VLIDARGAHGGHAGGSRGSRTVLPRPRRGAYAILRRWRPDGRGDRAHHPPRRDRRPHEPVSAACDGRAARGRSAIARHRHRRGGSSAAGNWRVPDRGRQPGGGCRARHPTRRRPRAYVVPRGRSRCVRPSATDTWSRICTAAVGVRPPSRASRPPACAPTAGSWSGTRSVTTAPPPGAQRSSTGRSSSGTCAWVDHFLYLRTVQHILGLRLTASRPTSGEGGQATVARW